MSAPKYLADEEDIVDPDREWKLLLEPYGNAYWTFHNAMQAMLRGQTDDELAALLEAASKVTTTNAWYATYDVAPLLTDEIKREQRDRGTRRFVDPQEAKPK